jgi:acyl dehydratase
MIFVEARTVSQADFDRFAALTGDRNPVHVDPEFAVCTRFGGTVSPGMLLYALVVSSLGRFLPGAVQREQFLMFPTGTHAGERVQVRLEVVERDDRTARLDTLVLRPGGEIACQGEMVVELSSGGRA